jgi:hypothetical protein
VFAALVLFGTAFGTGVLGAASAYAGPRLDREEREQLRNELRRQAREERQPGWPQRDGARRPARDEQRAPDSAGQAGMRPDGAPDRGSGRQRSAPDTRAGADDWRAPWRRGDGEPGDWRGPPRGGDRAERRSQRQEHLRMPPAEREQLRHMLREHRHGRRGD